MQQEQVEAVGHSTAVFSRCHPTRPSESLLGVHLVFFVPMPQWVLRESSGFCLFCSLLHPGASTQSLSRSDLIAANSRMTWAPPPAALTRQGTSIGPHSGLPCRSPLMQPAGLVGTVGQVVTEAAGWGGGSSGLQRGAGVRDERLGGLRLRGSRGRLGRCPGVGVVPAGGGRTCEGAEMGRGQR